MTVGALIRRVIWGAVTIYVAVTVLAALMLAHMALHPPRMPVDRAAFRQIAEPGRGQLPTSAKTGQMWGTGGVQDVSVRAADGAVLRGWYVEPPQAENENPHPSQNRAWMGHPNENPRPSQHRAWTGHPPEDTVNVDAVIILHGLADNRMGASGFAPAFLARGYRVLLPDSRGHGESGGAFITYGVKERDDVRRWINWLYAQAPPPRCVYLLGESMGAAIAIQAAAADPRICAVAAESAFATFRQIAYFRVGQFTGTGPWFGRTVGRPMVELALLFAYLRYGVNLADASPERALRQTRTPVLLIHGEADSNIPASNSVELHRAAPEHTELWLVPRADHGGASVVQPEEFNRRVLAWFDANPAR